MRISPISNNYGYNQGAPKFGRFKDKNAEEAIKTALSIKDKETGTLYFRPNDMFLLFKDIPYAEIYTDAKDDGKIKVRYNSKYINQAAGQNLDGRMKYFDDLSSPKDTHQLTSLYTNLRFIQDRIAGIPEPPPAPSDDYNDRRDRERIEMLIW